MRHIFSFAATLLLLVAGHVGAVAQETVTLSKVGPAITDLNEIVDGKQYVIWIKATAGNNRHGLVYVKSHDCGTSNENNRISGHNNDNVMPTAGTNVEVSAIFTVERDDETEGNPRFAFKTYSNKYIDSQDRGKNTAGGDPIHESDEKGLFYITKTGGGDVTLGENEADTWYLKSATAEGTRVFVNTGGADTGGLVLYPNKSTDNNNSKVCILPVETTVTLQGVGAPIKSIEEIVDGGQYMIWVVATAGAGRHGLVYTKYHECNAQNTNYRVTAHSNNDNTMPAAEVEVEGTSIFTVEVDNTDGGEPRFAFKAADGKYIDSSDRGKNTAGGDPIHESDEKGLFYITKTGGAGATLGENEADTWYLKSATETGNRVFVNTGGADGGGLVLYPNNANDNNNSKVKIIPVGTDVPLTNTSNLDNAATFSHKYDYDVTAPDNVKVYKIAETNENEARLSEISSRVIPANTGVILVGETVTHANLAATTTREVGDEAYAGNLLVGLPEGGTPDLTAGQTAYVFTLDGNDAVFKPYMTGSNFAAGKACLVLTEAAGASVLAIRLGGTTTGIDRVADKTESNAPKYDLSGRRVTNVARGSLYIQGGKTYIAR